jgi:PAS domain S-box-containing protein
MNEAKPDRTNASPPPLRVLITEDNPRDAKLAASILENAGFTVHHEVTDSLESFRERLEKADYDVILADYNLRNWTAMDALETLKQSGKDIPLIVVTGTLGDEAAVECVKQGAADFVLKDRPARLAAAVRRALEERKLREENKRAANELRQSEERYRLLFERNLAGVFRITLYGRVLHCNQAMAGLLGYDSPQKVLAHRIQDFYFTEEEHANFISELTAAGWVTNYEMRMRRQDGSPVWVIANVSTKAEAPGDLRVMEGTLVDITARKRAEQRLGEYEKAVEGLEEMLAVVDREYQYVIANHAFLRYYGIKRRQITKLRVRDLMGAELFDSVIKEQLDACFAGKVVRYELKLNSSRLGARDLFASLFPIEGSNGVDRAAIIIQDITDHKRAEDALRRSEAYLATGEKLSHTGSWAWNLSSGELYWSQETYRIFGFDPAATKASIQDSFLARIHPEDRPGIEEGLREASSRLNAFESDYRIVLPDSSIRHVHEIVYPVVDEAGKVVERFGVITDVTARRQAESEIKRLADIVNSSDDAIFSVTPERIIATWNAGAERMYGYTREDAIGKSMLMLIPEDRQDELAATAERLYRGEALSRYEYEHLRKDGSRFPVLLTLSPIKNAAGVVTGVSIIASDITERKRTERALLEERHLLHTLMDNLPDLIYFKDRDSRFTRINKALAREYGLNDPALALGKRDFDFSVPERAAEFYQDEQDIIRTGQPLVDKEEGGMWPDGHVAWLSTTKMPLRDANGNIIGTFGVSRNITERKQARERLHEYEKAVEGVDEMIAVVDREYRYLLANRAFLNQREMSREAVVGRLVPEVVGTEYFESFLKEKLDECFRGTVVRFETKHVYPSLGRRDLLISYFPIEGPHGVDRAACVLQDITERKKAEEELRLTHFSVEHAPDAVFWMNPEGRIVYANEAACRSLGRTREEVVALSVPDIDPLVSVAAWDATWEEIKTHGAMTHETQHRRKDGQTFPVEISAKYLEFGGNEYSFAFARDITERKRAEEAVRKANEMVRAVVQASPIAITVLDDDDKVLLYSPAAEKMFGWSAEEVVGGRLPYITGDAEGSHKDLLAQTQAGDRLSNVEMRRSRKDGTSVDFLLSTAPIFDAQGKAVAHVGVMNDITKRKRAEEALRQSEERFRQIAETIDEVFWMADPQIATIQYVSPAYERVWGRSTASLHANPRSFTEAIHPDDRTRVLADLEIQKSGQAFDHEYRVVRPDNTVRWVWDRGFPVHDDSGHIVRYVGVAVDITARKEAEAENARLVAAIEQAAEGVIITNTAGEIEYANPSFSRMTGYDRDDVLGRNPRILKSGKQDPAVYEHLWTTILSGNAWHGELVNRRKDGTLYTEELSVAPVRGARGEITHFIATKQDVTERRNLEIQLRQAQKMEAVGRLAGGVAHDFNNLLTIINGYSEMALRRVKSQDLLRNHIAEIRKAGERAASLTRQLLAFSRQQVLAPRILDVRNLVADIEKMLRRLIGEDIELVTIRHAASSQVKADPGQLEQILVNLVVNARDAMPQGGKLIIEVTNVVIEGTYVDQHPVVTPGHYVLMAVSDTGTGMTPEIQAHIFEPFFTTKEQGKGTGLGLAMVYGTVKQSGGYIWVYSELGRGATFKIYLPRIRDEAETAQDSEAPARPVMGSETILLVEDEEAVRALAARSLEEQGYKVLESTSPEDAIEISRRYTEPIHLLLTDVVLPRISGRKIAEHLTPLRPGMKVLYMSGYTDDTILRAGVLEAGTAFLQKPFTPTSLAHRVREVLDAGSGENPKGSANGN